MKRKIIAPALLVIVFIAAYLIICFGIPGMRIKLEAAPAEYFIESIKYMAFFKAAVSLAAALIADAIFLVLWRKK